MRPTRLLVGDVYTPIIHVRTFRQDPFGIRGPGPGAGGLCELVGDDTVFTLVVRSRMRTHSEERYKWTTTIVTITVHPRDVFPSPFLEFRRLCRLPLATTLSLGGRAITFLVAALAPTALSGGHRSRGQWLVGGSCSVSVARQERHEPFGVMCVCAGFHESLINVPNHCAQPS